MSVSNSSLHVTIGSEVVGANLTSGDLVDDTHTSNISTPMEQMGESADDTFNSSTVEDESVTVRVCVCVCGWVGVVGG